MTRETYIHPMAVVEPGAELGMGVHVGPFCHLSSECVIGDRTELIGHVTVLAATTVGAGCRIYPNAVLGAPPQNFRHKGGRTTLEIGRDCTIREGVTMHLGTDTSRGYTKVGDNGFFMAYSHIAHDCQVGDNVTMANYAGLGGHAEIGDSVTISGYAAVHQFVRIGHHAFLGGYAAVVGDVIPYGMAVGDRAKLRGFNLVGMKRAGVAHADLTTMRRAYRVLFDPERPFAKNVVLVKREFGNSPFVADILKFIEGREKRQFTVPGRLAPGDESDDDSD